MVLPVALAAVASAVTIAQGISTTAGTLSGMFSGGGEPGSDLDKADVNRLIGGLVVLQQGWGLLTDMEQGLETKDATWWAARPELEVELDIVFESVGSRLGTLDGRLKAWQLDPRLITPSQAKQLWKDAMDLVAPKIQAGHDVDTALDRKNLVAAALLCDSVAGGVFDPAKADWTKGSIGPDQLKRNGPLVAEVAVVYKRINDPD